MTDSVDKERRQILVRVTAEELEQIDRLANAARLSRNEYMLRTALGEMIDPDAVQAQLDDLTRRLERMEEAATLYQ